jgi:hypothetical protein
MLVSLNAIRSGMVAAKEAVGADVTDGALVEEHFEALSFSMDRLYNAAFDGDSGETLSDPDDAEMQQALSAIVLDALRATIALGLRLDLPPD